MTFQMSRTDFVLLSRMESTGFDDDTTDENLGLPNIGDLSILQPETRTRGPKNKLYNLSSPYVYALAKWAAVIRYQDYIDPLHESEAAQCYEGEPGTCRCTLIIYLSCVQPKCINQTG